MMQRFLSSIGAFALIGTLSMPVLAETSGSGTKTDSRIIYLNFSENQVYRVRAGFGYVSTVVFPNGEKVVSTDIGDSFNWEVKETSAGDRIYVKIVKPAPEPTNITVHTTRRTYTFFLAPERNPDRVGFRYQFNFPNAKVSRAKAVNTSVLAFKNAQRKGRVPNTDYGFTGDKWIKPLQAWDDGSKTYIRVPRAAGRVAIFAVSPNGSERTINSRDLSDGTIVVNGVYPQLSMRSGEYHGCLFNTPFYRSKSAAPARSTVSKPKVTTNGR